MQYLRVKNWEKLQHYKDRSPPWIKLHRDLLRDYEFTCLQDASKLQLMLIWLLASQMDNKIPADKNFIKNQIGISNDLNLNELIEKGFLIDDSGMLATRKQHAIVETETETETETEIEYKKQKKSKAIKPNFVSEVVWNDFLLLRRAKKAPLTQTALDKIQIEAGKAGISLEEALAECCTRGWQGFKADWYMKEDERISKNDRTKRAAQGLIEWVEG